MSDDDLKKLPAVNSPDFKVKSIDNVNHKPHIYCITPKHLQHNQSMFLGKDQIESMERDHGGMCGMYSDGRRTMTKFFTGASRCQVLIGDHSSDKVLFVQALTNEKDPNKWAGFTDWMKQTKPIMISLKIDGIAFVAPPGKGDS